jgi:predicted methyltransferase
MRRLVFAIALVLALPHAVHGALDPIAAAIAAPDRSDADRARDARDKPEVTLALTGLEPGMRVLDLFCGSGYYSELAARVVGPKGKVYAHSNKAYEAYAGKELAARLAARPMPQLVRLDREIESLGLPPDSIDVVLLVMAYHDAYWKEKDWTVTPGPLLNAIHAVLRPGGKVLVVDHAALTGSGSNAVQELHRIDETVERADFARAGFTLAATSDALRNPADDRRLSVFKEAIRGKTDRFVLVFEKPAPDQAGESPEKTP